jgi:hypothetical protein
LLAEFDADGLQLLTAEELTELYRLTARPVPPCSYAIDRYGIPLSVRKALRDALLRRVPSKTVPSRDPRFWLDELDLPELLKAQLRDCFAVGFWRGPSDPQEAWELRMGCSSPSRRDP